MMTLLMGAAMLMAPIAFSQKNDPAEAAIVAILQRQADGWNANDAAAFARDFTEDASFINVRGDLMRGHEAIVKIHSFIFAGPYKNTHLDTRLESITYPAPSVAIVDTVMTVTGFHTLPPGLVPTEPGTLRTRMKFILVDRGGEWKIVAGQNTGISPATMEVR